MDRKTLMTITLCFAIFALWQKFYIEPRMPVATTSVATQIQSQTPVAGGSTSNAPAAPGTPTSQSIPEKTEILSTPTGDVVIGNGSQAFVGWNLKSYRLGLAPETAAVDLKSVTNEPGQVELAFDDPALAYLSHVRGTLEKSASGVSWKYEDANVRLTRLITSAGDKPYVNLEMTAEFKSKHPNYAFLSLASESSKDDTEAQDRQLVYFTAQSIERIRLKEVALKEVATPVKYIAATNRYFLMAVVPQGALEPKALVQPTGQYSARANLVYPVTGNSMTFSSRVYFGPKELELIRAVDPTLDHTVDFGWFTVIAYPILKILKWIYQFVGNYGVAIILLTILLKIVTFPLTYKSMKSMKEMAKIQPQIAKLKEKHKDDKEALNKEMLTLMRGNGYNPAAGCLPMLIQMPIFFALYRVLYSSIELYHAPFAMWIHDLSGRDPFYVTPVLLSATMFIQQKIQPNTATDPAQQKMMQMMPLIFGAFMISLPSGLTLYMLVNALATIVQQYFLNKKLDIRNGRAVPARA